MALATTMYEMEAMIRGYHVYATVWDAQIGEELYCATETGNIRDPYAAWVCTRGHWKFSLNNFHGSRCIRENSEN